MREPDKPNHQRHHDFFRNNYRLRVTRFPAQGRGRGRGAAPALPTFCRVLAISKPASDSEIHFEVWLPAAESWNGKFQGTGNGGYSGALDYTAMQKLLGEGYAAAGSDTGHPGDDLKFAVGHRGKIDDWGWRAIHTMTERRRN